MMKKNIPILMYHSIEKMPKTTVMRSLHVAPIRFKFQMWLLNLLGYKGLSIRELTPYLKKQKIGKVVGITFDDGYQNNLINAAPVLKKYNFSATCFIVSDRIGSSNVWDSEKGITQRSLMTSNEIQAWLDLGMDIGAHTKTHVDLISSNEIEIKKQIKESKVDLEKKFDLKIVDFCYPFGCYNKAVVDIVEDSGYESAVTMNRGRVKDFPSQFELPRIPINYHTLPHLFLMKVLTRYEDKK